MLQNSNVGYHSYTEDTQIYLEFSPDTWVQYSPSVIVYSKLIAWTKISCS